MGTRQFERLVRQSVLDRLIDDPDNPEPRTWDQSVSAFRASVMRDLEWLLNTRRVFPTASEKLDLVRSSIYHFGIPDLSSRSAQSMEARTQLQREVYEAIANFEPRMSKVRVNLVPQQLTGPNSERSVRFQIEGEMRTDPTPQAVVFETKLDMASKAISLKATDDA
jgi:type VI secretion system protein ImpF